jgi:hypothetical protein
MEKFPIITPGSDSQNSQRDSKEAKMLAQVRQAGIAPPIANRETDLVIPRAAWSAWHEANKPRCLRRTLTEDERAALQRRKTELEPWVVGYHDSEKTSIAIAVSKMFNAFPAYAMKTIGAGVVAQVDSVLQVLEPYPAWAIIRACKKISEQGYVRTDGVGEYSRETHWPPSAPELIEQVRMVATLYTDTYKNVVALLEAEVER